MPPKTPKNPASDKPEDGQLADQVQPSVPALTATLEAAAQTLSAEALPATDPDPLLPLVDPIHEVLDTEMTAQTPVAGHLRVRVLRVIEHDGVRYGPGEQAGDELEVTEAQFQLLNLIQAAERL